MTKWSGGSVFRKMYAWFVLATALQVSKLRKYWCGVVLGKRTDTGTIDGYSSVRRGGATGAAVLGFWASVKSARRETRREKRRKQYPGSRRTRGRE